MVDAAVRSVPTTRDPTAAAFEELQALARARLDAPAPDARAAAAKGPAPAEPPAELAPRTSRLLARVIDVGLASVLAAPGVLAGVGLVATYFARTETWWHGLARGTAWTVLVVSALATVALILYQWAGMALEGQTIGKRRMNVRVVLQDGGSVGFYEAVLLRSWVTGALAALPYVGQAAYTLDALLILGSERRCLHDLLAGTKVVSTLPPRAPRRRWLQRGLWAAALLALGVGVGAWARPDLARAAYDQVAAGVTTLRGGAPAAQPAVEVATPQAQRASAEAPAAAPFAGAVVPAASADVDQALAALRGPAPRARWEAAQALGRTPAAAGRADVTAALLRALQEDEHFMVRADAASALGRVGADADTTVAAALGRAAASDPSDAVRSAASAALR